MNGSIFDSALSHTRRSDASEKREEISVSTFERFRLSSSFESPPVSVNTKMNMKIFTLECQIFPLPIVIISGPFLPHVPPVVEIEAVVSDVFFDDHLLSVKKS